MFITIEGIDGCGKSSQSKRLATWLTDRTGRTTFSTFEPGGYPEGRALRKFILESRNFSPKSELLLFLADRAEHTKKLIVPVLSLGYNVICERWNESTIAYQSGGHKLDIQEVRRLIEACNFPEPDAKIWLDVPPELAVSRMLSRRKHGIKAPGDKFEEEGLALMQRVSEAYRELAESGQLIRIDCGEADKAEVFAMITAELERHLAH